MGCGGRKKSEKPSHHGWTFNKRNKLTSKYLYMYNYV